MSVHGTARFADRYELAEAGLVSWSESLTPERGLMVGALAYTGRGGSYYEAIRYEGDLHQLIVAGTGGGKFTTAIAPLLINSNLEKETVVVVDPKGEVAKLTGVYFQEAFAKERSIYFLDPWDETGTGVTSVLNPLASITQDNPNYVDDARALADALVMPSGSDNTHWDNAARNFLAAVILYVALSPNENSRDLMRVREIITLPFAMGKAYVGVKRESLIELLMSQVDSEIGDGAVRRGFRSIMNREEKERSGIISSIDRDTAWIDSPQMLKVLRGDTIDLKKAALEGGKYYVVLPPDFFMTHRGWLRIVITTFARAFRRYRPDTPMSGPKRWRHIVIDEFANLGEMSFVQNDVAVSRGYSVKYHLAVQDLSQLRHVYRDAWESFINNTFQRFFAIGDMFTAEYVSRMLGTSTVFSTSYTDGRTGGTSYGMTYGTSDSYGSHSSTSPTGGSGRSTSYGSSMSSSHTENSGWSQSTTSSETKRELMTPDEVRRMSDIQQLVFIRGMLPINCLRPPYWKAFPNLPTYSLPALLDTIGRKPRDHIEANIFSDWRKQPLLLMPPPAVIEPVAELPNAATATSKTSFSLPRWAPWVALGAMALAVYLIAGRRSPEPAAPPPSTQPAPVIVPPLSSQAPKRPLSAEERDKILRESQKMADDLKHPFQGMVIPKDIQKELPPSRPLRRLPN